MNHKIFCLDLKINNYPKGSAKKCNQKFRRRFFWLYSLFLQQLTASSVTAVIAIVSKAEYLAIYGRFRVRVVRTWDLIEANFSLTTFPYIRQVLLLLSIGEHLSILSCYLDVVHWIFCRSFRRSNMMLTSWYLDL